MLRLGHLGMCMTECRVPNTRSRSAQNAFRCVVVNNGNGSYYEPYDTCEKRGTRQSVKFKTNMPLRSATQPVP